MADLNKECPFPPDKPCNKLKELKKRIAELESKLVRMQYHDDAIYQERVFKIKYSDLLEPVEAIDIFVRNIQRIFRKENEDDFCSYGERREGE